MHRGFLRLVLKWVFVTRSLDFKISRFNGRLMTSSKIRRLRIRFGDLIVAGKGEYLQFVILKECMATSILH
ncbi:hypothetical protein L2E82_50720 [Cichorium intybus]|nr:hypothetical protein L2E82_50720 [Cichorium intybus]